MSNLEAWLIIILVLGVIASNIAVLKYSAKFKMPQFGKAPTKKSQAKTTDDSAKQEAESSTTSTSPGPNDDKQ
ncbi:hypothetical protein BEL05_05185 [Shewanella colwelliana]|uniref:DUF2897 domain-containing protein n=1 Tax=Shewanella colwelliana TaxID=23 RepID=A0A1E5IPF5_SHECO|nr:DUF2897 family protein [Shewanella colwelliana]OEG72370.1 hypothetical protein BEL05_05185 [Shewanella colwelliana]